MRLADGRSGVGQPTTANGPPAQRIARRAAEIMRANPGHSRDDIVRALLAAEGASWAEKGEEYQEIVAAVMLGTWEFTSAPWTPPPGPRRLRR